MLELLTGMALRVYTREVSTRHTPTIYLGIPVIRLQKFKMDALRRCFELGEDVEYVSREIGYSRASIYKWKL